MKSFYKPLILALFAMLATPALADGGYSGRGYRGGVAFCDRPLCVFLGNNGLRRPHHVYRHPRPFFGDTGLRRPHRVQRHHRPNRWGPRPRRRFSGHWHGGTFHRQPHFQGRHGGNRHGVSRRHRSRSDVWRSRVERRRSHVSPDRRARNVARPARRRNHGG